MCVCVCRRDGVQHESGWERAVDGDERWAMTDTVKVDRRAAAALASLLVL